MEISFDPHNKYPINEVQAIEACGLVLPWVFEWVYWKEPSPPIPLSVHLEQCYGYPLYQIPGAEIDESETFLFPGDDPLTPLVSLKHAGAHFLMYWHALAAIKDSPDRPYLITRMD
jgi:hypothetical protein